MYVTCKNKHKKIKILNDLPFPIQYHTLEKTYVPKIKYIDDEGRTPLMIACIHNNVDDIYKYISEINCVDDDGWTALMYASHGGNSTIVNLLLEHRADLHKTTHSGLKANQLAYFNGHYDISEKLSLL